MKYGVLKVETPELNKEVLKSIIIQQDSNIYSLDVEIEEDLIILNICIKEKTGDLKYIRKFYFNELKQIHKSFFLFNSFKDFYEYLQKLAENKKIIFFKNEKNLIMNFFVDYLLKQEIIELTFFPIKLNIDAVIDHMQNMKNIIKEKIKTLENYLQKGKNDSEEKIKRLVKENEDLKNENIKLKENIEKNNKEIKIMKEEINQIKNFKNEIIKLKSKKINSVIMYDIELDLINSAIKNRMNKEIKEIKKIYQATVDGGQPINFHSKCDNVPNTLILIKSAKNRRFGGFTSTVWDSSSKYKEDKNAFIFSLDKKKIYPLKETHSAIYCSKESGPCFGDGFDIWVEGDLIKEKKLSCFKGSYEHDGDFLEVYYPENTFAFELEVFQIIF